MAPVKQQVSIKPLNSAWDHVWHLLGRGVLDDILIGVITDIPGRFWNQVTAQLENDINETY